MPGEKMADWPYKKVTLIKPLVGRVRTPSSPLPGPAHVYGARTQQDSESAATLLSKWTTAAAATAPHGSRLPCTANGDGKAQPYSWIRSNVLALKHGNPTARTQRAFAKRHPSITVPVKRIVSSNKASGADATAEGASSSSSSSASRAQALAATGFVFGRATARNGETLKDVVSARFAPAMLEPEPDYPPRIVAVLSARMPKPRPTRSSRLLRTAQEAQRRRLAEQEEAARTGIPPGGPLWTMPRWRKAVAKMSRNGAPVAAAV